MKITIPPIGEVSLKTPSDQMYSEWMYKLNYAQYYNLGKGLTYIPNNFGE